MPIIFHLKKTWVVDDQKYYLWEDIKSGIKTSEYREASKFWLKRLPIGSCNLKAWFVIGYPKNNLPRLEADIYEIIHHKYVKLLEIKFKNIKEIKEKKISKINSNKNSNF